MSAPEDNAAFPRPSANGWPAQDGMTLRDWFAGQAYAAMCQVNRDYLTKVAKDKDFPFHAAVAKDAYEAADAMLAARGDAA